MDGTTETQIANHTTNSYTEVLSPILQKRKERKKEVERGRDRKCKAMAGLSAPLCTNVCVCVIPNSVLKIIAALVGVLHWAGLGLSGEAIVE